MSNKRTVYLFIFWVVSSVTLLKVTQYTSQQHVESLIEQKVRTYLRASYDESLFSDKSFSRTTNRVNDQRSLVTVGEKINTVLENTLVSKCYSPLRVEDLRFLSIDQVKIADASLVDETLAFSIDRNQLPRLAVFAYRAHLNLKVYCALVVFLGLILFALKKVLPEPLSTHHRKWLYYLGNRSYDNDEAYRVVRDIDGGSLNLNEQQWKIFHLLHKPAEKNFPEAISTVIDKRLSRFSELQMEWFLITLRNDIDIAHAWSVALAPDTVTINLVASELTIHGVEIPMSKTPLFYYGWYANQCLSSDGWVTNPRSNKPDKNQGKQLAKIMWEHHGHAKAIGDLEEVGLKAKTLDQNRSKIKDELVATLGDILAGYYLFDAKKDQGCTSYRLKLMPYQIELLSL